MIVHQSPHCFAFLALFYLRHGSHCCRKRERLSWRHCLEAVRGLEKAIFSCPACRRRSPPLGPWQKGIRQNKSNKRKQRDLSLCSRPRKKESGEGVGDKQFSFTVSCAVLCGLIYAADHTENVKVMITETSAVNI